MNRELRKQITKHAAFLREKSKKICADNDCTEKTHNCESNAYYDIELDDKNNITALQLVDVCYPDYMQRSTNTIVYLPFNGTGNDLIEQLIENYLD